MALLRYLTKTTSFFVIFAVIKYMYIFIAHLTVYILLQFDHKKATLFRKNWKTVFSVLRQLFVVELINFKKI